MHCWCMSLRRIQVNSRVCVAAFPFVLTSDQCSNRWYVGPACNTPFKKALQPWWSIWLAATLLLELVALLGSIGHIAQRVRMVHLQGNRYTGHIAAHHMQLCTAHHDGECFWLTDVPFRHSCESVCAMH